MTPTDTLHRFGPARVNDLVAQLADSTPSAQALVLDGESMSYAQLHYRIEVTARALLAAGIRKGDRVATLATPHPDYLITFLASASIGAIWLGLNPRYRSDELCYAVGDSEPAVLFTRTKIGDRDYLPEIAAMRAAAPSMREVITLGTGPLPPCASGFEAFAARGIDVSPEQLARVHQNCGGRDPCLLVYTSGSTGRPKGALLHHEGLVEFSLAQNRAWPVPRQRMLNFFPINHVGCVIDVSMPTLAAGGCLVFMEQFSPEGALALMARERISIWGLVPSAFQLQLALPQFGDFDLSAVELILWEGAAMPVEYIRRLRAVCPRLATNYGMTETTSAITIVHPTDDLDVLADSVGFPFEGVEVRLVKEDGQIAATGEAGEIQARSFYNMLGYWRRPKETAETLLPDGWLRTGDLGVQRPDGRYRIVGRIKDMFKSGGYNVYPREVEDAIEAHPGVVMAAVVSRPDPLWQEVGVAFVVPLGSLSADELERHCRERLANFKIPKEFIFCGALPLLPIGKVDKVALRKRAATS